MKVLLVNGSPHKKGCIFTALSEVGKSLEQHGIETEIYWIGNEALSGCTGCYQCVDKKKCAIDDRVNEFTEYAAGFDGFVFGSPVYFSGMAGGLKSFLDRAFYSSSHREDNPFRFKPAAAVVSARRAGTTSALDQIHKYFYIQQMLIVPSRYWTMVHGRKPSEVMQDEEGLQIMRVLGRNMAWVLKLKEAGMKAGISLPKDEEERISTSFIR